MRRTASVHDGTDDRPNARDRPAEDPEGGDAGGRGLLKGATAALLGMAGIGALGGTASAGGNSKSLLVFGDGWKKHSYQIGVKSGGSIQKGTHAGSNDNRTWNDERVYGELWQWNVDSYTFTGEIEQVTLDGSLSVHFPDGAFESATNVHVDGQSSGDHLYDVGTNSADIDLVPGTTEGKDTDEGGSWSERTYTNDRISGKVVDTGHDSYSFGSGDPIQHLAVSEGNVRFSR
jgi:hypothetical protein